MNKYRATIENLFCMLELYGYASVQVIDTLGVNSTLRHYLTQCVQR